ncbi:MAG: antitoxin [Sphingomonadaceae bacterium]
MNIQRRASLFRNGRNQAVRIPKEFEFAEDEVLISKDGARLVIEAVPRDLTLGEWLATLEPSDVEWPEIEDPHPEPVDI